jgi:hypothetical protein
MFRRAGRGFARKGVGSSPFDVPSANGSLGAPGHLRRQTNDRLTSTPVISDGGFFDLIDFLEGRWLWVLARHLDQVEPDADFIPAASRALYTLPRPMFSAVAMSVTERPALKSFTASSALSRADGLRPM